MPDLVLPVDKKPWDRLENEPDKAWSAFQVFLNMSKPRRLGLMSAQYGFSDKSVRMWSAKYKWTIRSKLYDNTLMGVPTPEERAATLGALQINIIQDAHSDYIALRDAWRSLVDKLLESGDATPREIKDLAEARSKLDIMARRTARMPTSILPEQEQDGLADDDGTAWILDPQKGPVKAVVNGG